MKGLLVVVVIIIIVCLAMPTSKSVVPTPETASIVPIPAVAVAAPSAVGNLEVVPKAKYIELKKIAKTPGNPEYAGIMNIKKIHTTLEPNQGIGGGITIKATASSSMGSATPDQAINYGNPATMWHTKITSAVGEWIQLELSTPVALKSITIENRDDVAGGPDDESARIIGTQVTIMDADSKPIKTYIIAENSKTITLAGH